MATKITEPAANKPLMMTAGFCLLIDFFIEFFPMFVDARKHQWKLASQSISYLFDQFDELYGNWIDFDFNNYFVDSVLDSSTNNLQIISILFIYLMKLVEKGWPGVASFDWLVAKNLQFATKNQSQVQDRGDSARRRPCFFDLTASSNLHISPPVGVPSSGDTLLNC